MQASLPLPRPWRARTAVRALLATGALAGASLPAAAQVTFSIDWRGQVISQPSTGGPLITEADLMRPGLGQPAPGPLPNPQIVTLGAQLGLTNYSMCVGHPVGSECGIEVDAFSYGNDAPFDLNPDPLTGVRLFFSVDKFAVGRATPFAPSVFSEAAVQDAAADVFTVPVLPPGPLPPAAVLPINAGVMDGDGLPSGSGKAYRGLGMIEPHPLAPPPPIVPLGDELDAFHLGGPTARPGSAFYFSIDGGIPIDPLGYPAGQTQSVQGLSSAAVLRVPLAGGAPVVYATPGQLGLNLFGPDDVDALIVHDNGDGIYQRPTALFGWLPGTPGGPKDLIAFSVRRGSAVIGRPDSIFGLPIEPGDVLIPPIDATLVATTPGIFIAAENLGLQTMRTDGVPFGDELDGMASDDEPCYDCNGNGTEDAVDIATGFSMDANSNGIPDECEPLGATHCAGDGTGMACPCANTGASGHGCANSVHASGALLAGVGIASVGADTVALVGSSMPNSTCTYFQGTGTASVQLYDGILCTGGSIIRLGTKTNAMFASQWPTAGDPSVSVRGMIPAAGGTRYYQIFYRNAAAAFCPPATANYSNGVQIVWVP